MKTIRFTKEGYEKLRLKLNTLQKSRPDAVADLKKARDMGDLSENGYYKAAKGKLVSIDRDLRYFTQQLKEGTIINNTKSSIINIGTTVIVNDGTKDVTYKIVGDLEAQPSKGKISLLSPIGKALMNKKINEKVTVKTPGGIITYTILKIS